MEFWGVEVKPGEPLKVQPEFGKLIHISQAALGEVKDVKGAKHVPLRLKIDAKNFIIGSLSAEGRTQLIFDLVFEREFELSHDWKNGSVYFIGYIADDSVSGGEDFSDKSEDEVEDEPVDTHENGNLKPKIGDSKAAKNVAAAAKGGIKKEKQPASDEDDSEFDSDDEMAFSRPLKEDSSDVSAEDSEEVMDGSFSSEEELSKVQQTKKRPAESAQGPPLAKKAKSATPDNTGNKQGHMTTPLTSKKAGKGSASNKSNKSGGQMSFKSRNK